MEGDQAFPPNWFTPSGISIHALRVEGDGSLLEPLFTRLISIHALRVEGDDSVEFVNNVTCISIHALRVEGDLLLLL